MVISCSSRAPSGADPCMPYAWKLSLCEFHSSLDLLCCERPAFFVSSIPSDSSTPPFSFFEGFPEPYGEGVWWGHISKAECSKISLLILSGCMSLYFFPSAAAGDIQDEGWIGTNWWVYKSIIGSHCSVLFNTSIWFSQAPGLCRLRLLATQGVLGIGWVSHMGSYSDIWHIS